MNCYELADKLDYKQINNIVSYWEDNNKTKLISDFNQLIRLGDSRRIAMATTLIYSKKQDASDIYRNAYES